MIKLKWHGIVPDNMLEIEDIVRQDLIQIDEDLEGKSSGLIFHNVFLEGDLDGPLVFVWGEKSDDEQYHCEYDPNPQWVSLEDEKSFDKGEDLKL